MKTFIQRFYVRLQTWFPFTVHGGMNGREWLARQMDKSGLRDRRRDNCFAWIEDWARGQQLMDEQLRTDWPGLLKRLLDQANPALGIVDPHPAAAYYWSMEEGEWASDLAFAAPAALAELAPRLFRHAWLNFDSGDMIPNVSRTDSTARNTTSVRIRDLRLIRGCYLRLMPLGGAPKRRVARRV